MPWNSTCSLIGLQISSHGTYIRVTSVQPTTIVIKMKRWKYFPYLIGSLLHSFLFLIIPDYFIWFLVLLGLGLMVCILFFIIDICRKTKNWRTVFSILGFAIFSYCMGFILLIIRNHYL
jgi:hypothetical protein